MKPIVLSKHAFVRMRERFPEAVSELEQRVIGEVREAIESGRRAKNPPAFLIGKKATQGTRFVWTACERRVYVVAEKRVNGRPGMIVVTVLHSTDEETVERRKLVGPPGKVAKNGKHAARSIKAPNWKGWTA